MARAIVAVLVVAVLGGGAILLARQGAGRGPESPDAVDARTRMASTPPEGPQTPAPPTPAPPTPAPPTSDHAAEAPPGSARVEDAAGDVGDEAGARVEVHGSADLTAVELVGNRAELVVTWELAAPPPAQHDALLWTVDLWVEGARAYTVSVQQVGAQRLAGILDWATSQQAPLEPPEVAGPLLRVRVPAALTPRLGARFSWSALSQIDMAYEDSAPDAPPDGTVTAPFPQ